MNTNCRIKFEQFQTDERDPLSWPSSKLVPDKSFAEIMNRLALDIRKNAELQKSFIINYILIMNLIKIKTLYNNFCHI